MKSAIIISSIIVFTSTFAKAISLCGDVPVDACAKAIENIYVEQYAASHQEKESPLSRAEFVKNLKEAAGSDQFNALYRKCTESADTQDAAISCIGNGFPLLLMRKVGNKEAQQFIQKTLPSIVKNWDANTFYQNAVSFFPKDEYQKVSKIFTTSFGGCEVGTMEEKGRKFSMTHGVPMHEYVVLLTCEKIKNSDVELRVVEENGAWKYAWIHVRKRAGM